MPQATLFTMGLGNKSPDEILSLLSTHSCSRLIDIRSYRSSPRVPFYAESSLRAFCENNQIAYSALGDHLGGFPKFNPEATDSQGKPDYQAMSRLPRFLEGIRLLLREAQEPGNIMLCCAETSPLQCHRNLLLGAHLLEHHNVILQHLSSDGTILDQQTLSSRPVQSELPLF